MPSRNGSFLPGFHVNSVICLCACGFGRRPSIEGTVLCGNILRRVRDSRVIIRLASKRRGTSVFRVGLPCTVRRKADSTSAKKDVHGLRRFVYTPGSGHSLLLKRHIPRESASRRLAERCSSMLSSVVLHTGRTRSCFLLIKPPKAKGADHTLGFVIRRTLGSKAKVPATRDVTTKNGSTFRPTSSVLLVDCAGHTISRVYRVLMSSNVPFLHLNDRCSYSRQFHPCLVRGTVDSYPGLRTVGRCVVNAHIVINAASVVASGPFVFALGRFGLTVVSRSDRVLRPGLVNLLSTMSGFVLVNSCGRLPTIIRRDRGSSNVPAVGSDRGKNIVSVDVLRSVYLAGYHGSLFRHLVE